MVHRTLAPLLCGIVLLALGTRCSGSHQTQQQRNASSGCAGEDRTGLPAEWQGRSAERIVFLDECEPGGFARMYSIRLDGRGVRRLASQISDAAVSPDRSEVAFEDDSGFPGGITVIRVDGSHERLLDAEQESVIDGSPAWSPDGLMLVFVRTKSPAPSGALFASVLYTINANGTGRRRLAGSAVDNPGPSWINKRQILITAAQRELAIISATTGTVERLIPLPRAGTQPAPDPAAVAPSGRELAYVECDNEDCSSTSVDLITTRGKLLRRMVGAHTPAWAPQGNLLYACCQQAGISGNTSVIVMTPAQNGKARTITPTRFSADDPQWLGLRAAR